jgi:hypothetical protein
MPYFIDEKNCVRKGTKDAPGEVVKCHGSPGEAVTHLQALYANVEDAKEIDLPVGIFDYKEGDQNRWVSISTVDETDADGESFGTEAMDYAIRWAKEADDYPELRLIHVRGAKIGKCDKMNRYGRYAVDEGYYFDSPLAKEALAAVTRGDMPHTSRGFQVVEATGTCPCGARLRVAPFALKVGYQCPSCDQLYTGKALSGIRFTKARVFDISITDRPAVRSTAIANFTIVKEQAMSREEIKKRLVAANFKEEVVDAWLEGLSEDDLSRMKEETLVASFKEAVQSASKEEEPFTESKMDSEEGDEYPMVAMKGGMVTCTKCGTKMRIRAGQSDTTKDIEIDFDPLIEAIKEAMPKFEGVEVEITGIEEQFKSIESKLEALTTEVKELNKTAEERAKESLINDASQATLSRLRFRARTKEEVDERRKEQKQPPVLTTGDGGEFGSLTEAFNALEDASKES